MGDRSTDMSKEDDRDDTSLPNDPYPSNSRSGGTERNLKSRAILSSEEAVEIFLLALPNEASEASSQAGARTRPSAIVVAREYGVSEKTVRDIWTGRTW